MDVMSLLLFVSFDQSETTMAELKDALAKTGDEVGLQIHVQHENIFRATNEVRPVMDLRRNG